ncbi:hypothetical protein FLONG3_213 [Fusarium longipes]|uniref:Uncharacterized protein n=1 Tax=Fusarium longipes TaxID=694270 RepID=A0A395TAW8_9HYPO|nr:hypothetical protein FLONG3_213 [Fusarium longipes]
MADAASSNNFDVQSALDGVGSLLRSLTNQAIKKGVVELPGTVHVFDAFQFVGNELRYNPPSSTTLELSLLAYAASQGNCAEVEILLLASKAKKQPGKDYDGMFCSVLDKALDEALFLAHFYGHKDVAEQLLRYGAKPGVETSVHCGIHGAAGRGQRDEIIKYITTCRVEPDVDDRSGGTPVIYAMSLDSPHDWNTIKLLFQLEANTQAKLGAGRLEKFWSYPDFARAMGKEDLAKKIEQAIVLDKSQKEMPDYDLID